MFAAIHASEASNVNQENKRANLVGLGRARAAALSCAFRFLIRSLG